MSNQSKCEGNLYRKCETLTMFERYRRWKSRDLLLNFKESMPKQIRKNKE